MSQRAGDRPAVFPLARQSSEFWTADCLPASRQQYLFDICLLLYVQSLTPDDGRKDRPKHVECHKAVPLQAWSGPEGSKKLRFPDFMTTAQDGGKVVSSTHRPPLPPGNTPGTHLC